MSHKENMHKVSSSPTPYLNITVSSLYKKKGKERNSQDRCADRRKNRVKWCCIACRSRQLRRSRGLVDVDNISSTSSSSCCLQGDLLDHRLARCGLSTSSSFPHVDKTVAFFIPARFVRKEIPTIV